MALCPTCEYELPTDPRTARQSLSELSGSAVRASHREPTDSSWRGSLLPSTPNTEASGPCQRCGVDMCEVCRCRWDEQAICASCVDQALQGAEGSATPTRALQRQSLQSIALGLAAWTLGTVAVVLGRTFGITTGEVHPLAALAILLCVCGGSVVALFAMGQASAWSPSTWLTRPFRDGRPRVGPACSSESR